MRWKQRQILRRILIYTTKLVLKRHGTEVIVVTGNGQTSVVREILYSMLHEDFNTRRTLELPEAEFSIPITVFGDFTYPDSKTGWVFLLLRTFARLIKNKPFKHILILEIPRINREVYNLWVGILSPKFIVEVPDYLDLVSHPESCLPLINDVLAEYRIDLRLAVHRIKKLNFPLSRIKVTTGPKGSTIVDSRHYYYPAPLSSVMELIKSMDGRKVLFTPLKQDLKEITTLDKNILVNPSKFFPEESDIVILRGPKDSKYEFERQ